MISQYQTIRKLKEEYERWGLTINIKKTKYLCIGEEIEPLQLDNGEIIEPSTECIYLGTKIDQFGKSNTEIEHRISETKKAINALNSLWWNKHITRNRKLQIYKTVIQSILTYGAEVWQISTREQNKILATEMDVLRRSAGKSRKERVKNRQIKEIMKVEEEPDIIDVIEKKRLQWYGHVKRMTEERLPRQIMEWIPTERRKRGRPAKTWIEGVQTAMTSRNLTPEQWMDREDWRLVSGRRRQQS